jgi:tRNA threonylcarbamoyladenosine biosynthesis protein TsaB
MRVLALDTTTRAGSAALVEDDRVVLERTGDPTRSHAERLPADLMMLLDAAGVTLDAIDLFAVSSGPGSFTGLRIGIATIQGLAFVTGRRVVPVPTLEALGHAASRELTAGATVAAWMNAQRGEVFAALYEVRGGAPFALEALHEVDTAVAVRPDEIFERWTARGIRPDAFIGDGADAYAAVIAAPSLDRTRLSTAGRAILTTPPLAATIGMIGVQRGRAGVSVHPAGIQPLYVRRPDAELARDRQG